MDSKNSEKPLYLWLWFSTPKLAKLRQGNGTQGRDSELPGMTSLLSSPYGLVWMAPISPATTSENTHEYCQQEKLMPALVFKVFTGAWSYTYGWPTAWPAVVSSPFRGWAAKCSKAFTRNHIITLTICMFQSPQANEDVFWGKDISSALRSLPRSQGQRPRFSVARVISATGVLFLALTLIAIFDSSEHGFPHL